MSRINKTVLMSDALHFTNDQAINPYYGSASVSSATAQSEHASIRTALEDAGVTVVSVPSPAASQDGVYTANWALVRGDLAILARLPTVRKAEEAYASAALTSLGKTVLKVPGSLRFSGQGDALACGNLLFCGQGYRSDLEAQKFAADTLGYDRVQVQTIPQLDIAGVPVINAVSGWPDSYFYDIDLALAVLKHPDGKTKGLIAYCPEAFTEESQRILEALTSVDKIKVPLAEAQHAFATNLVSTGDTVIMSDAAPSLAAQLQKYGLKIVTPHVAELAKGGGYIRCTTLSID